MRDVLVTAIIFSSIPFIIRRPYLGVLMYVWISIMNPHRLTWGFAYDFSFAWIIAVVTLVSCVFSRDLRRPPANGLTVALLLFAAWTGITTAFSLYPAQSYEIATGLMKTLIIAFLIPMLFHRPEQLRQLLWVIVLSVAYYGVKGGAWFLLTGGEYRIYGPSGSYIEDNNYLAVAVIMTIPFMRYLQLTSPHRSVRWGLTGMMLLCGVAALGSYSRGALLAACAMLATLLWKGRQKLLLSLIVVATIPAVLLYLPERWYQRMDTIVNFEQDDSASARLNAWATMFRLAQDRPLVGGGFNVAEAPVFEKYAPDTRFHAQVAHSIYFQALGEHGFIGLGLYLLLYLMLWRYAGWLSRATGGHPEFAWARDFGLMMQVSLVGFLVGGAFLSLVNFDVPYYLIGIVVATRRLIEAGLRKGAAPGAIGSSQPIIAARVESASKAGTS
jgi:probable O-glycosylation ligase (exosortase A-associated)